MSKLAMFGGDKAVTTDYQSECNLPIVPEKAYAVVEQMMRRGDISSSPVVTEFESKWAAYIGRKYCITSVNGTTCIQMALFGCGIGPGDEVIVPSFTFWASAGPIIAVGAKPVFVDIGLDTHNIDPADFEKRITPHTKAVVLVHCWGTPADTDAIIKIAKKHKLKIVEDASHAHGATLGGKKLGSFGDVACFSLQGSKTMPAGEGGLLVTDDRELFERAVSLGHYERLFSMPDDSPYKQYKMTGLGYKHRVHPLGIAIASACFDELDERNAVRSKQAHELQNEAAKLGYIVKQTMPEGSERVFSYHYVRYESMALGGVTLDTLLKALSAEGVIVGSCGYGRLHQAPLYTLENAYRYENPKNLSPLADPVTLPVTEKLADTAFMLAPRFERECPSIVEQYIDAYKKIYDCAGELRSYEAEKGIREVKQDNAGRSVNLYR